MTVADLNPLKIFLNVGVPSEALFHCSIPCVLRYEQTEFLWVVDGRVSFQLLMLWTVVCATRVEVFAEIRLQNCLTDEYTGVY